jgi:uncharacterized membrane protein YtjA (UPF0391 family)
MRAPALPNIAALPFAAHYFYKKTTPMLRWSVIFFVVAIVAAIFGFTGISEGAASIAKILFGIFAVLFVLALIGGLTIFKKK